MPPPAITDLLLPEEALMERVRPVVPPQVRVFSTDNPELIREGAWPAPSVLIQYHADVAVSAKAQGKAVEFTQLWLAVIAVRNVADPFSGAPARRDAGPLVLAVLRTLMGWSPALGWSALEPARPPYRASYKNGLRLHPLAFTTTVQIRS